MIPMTALSGRVPVRCLRHKDGLELFLLAVGLNNARMHASRSWLTSFKLLGFSDLRYVIGKPTPYKAGRLLRTH